MTESTNPTATLQTIRDYCDEVLANATPTEPESASRMVAARVKEIANTALVADNDEDEPMCIPCCKCGQPTTWDSTYNDLCYRCCRADNE